MGVSYYLQNYWKRELESEQNFAFRAWPVPGVQILERGGNWETS